MGLHVISKAELWAAEDSLPEALDRPDPWHLKSIQDAIAFQTMRNAHGNKILEIGGGRSRLLPWFSATNECVLADPLDGRDGGPTRPARNINYEVVRELVAPGAHILITHRHEFDYVFSVSVVEHIEVDALPGFFGACATLLRKGGKMVHLIDYYIGDSSPAYGARQRLSAYVAPLEDRFTSTSDALDIHYLQFESWMATNPDNVMAQWNRSVPGLRTVRETHQSVTFLMDYIRS